MASWKTRYPRPQLRRESFLPLLDGWTLNGSPITLPFCPECKLSGFQGTLSDTMVYETEFTLPEGFVPEGYQVLLHFGAVDQVARVFVNGDHAFDHQGGYLPFWGNIKPLLQPGVNRLTLRVTDTLNHDYPYGKQRKDRGGMWYTPVSGIWQTVWLEAVPEMAVEGLKITPDLTGITLEARTKAPRCTARVFLAGVEIASASRVPAEGACRIDIPEEFRRLWTPDSPTLYDLTVTAGEDRVQSYFALRTVSIQPDGAGIQRLCLNGKPVFLNGVLDQGYFMGGIYLSEDPEEYDRDVLRMKELGFNLLRKHIKVEPEAFYEACDRLGMLVLQDMVNNGTYSFFMDTVLPTIGIRRLPSRPVSRRRKEIFERCAAQTQAHLYSHPCVIGYTIFNEGWGQFDADRLYRTLKAKDPTRFYDTASGWFIPRQTDVDSVHIYFRNKRLHPGKRPMLLSECGGYVRRIEGHLWNPEKEYGYGKTETARQLTDAMETLYSIMVKPAIPEGLCGVIYTQLSDVEDEINGLYTFDRQVCKVEKERLRAILKEDEALLPVPCTPASQP